MLVDPAPSLFRRPTLRAEISHSKNRRQDSEAADRACILDACCIFQHPLSLPAACSACSGTLLGRSASVQSPVLTTVARTGSLWCTTSRTGCVRGVGVTDIDAGLLGPIQQPFGLGAPLLEDPPLPLSIAGVL